MEDNTDHSLSTAELSDALDVFGLPGSALGIAPLTGHARLYGPAYTVRFIPVDVAAPGTVGDYIDDVPEGAVIVLDNAGRMDCTVWGGILSQLARQRGIAGTVINGVGRDTAEADACGYPLFARGRFMRTGKDRVQVQAVQVPVSLGDVCVRPGDMVAGDADGIVVIPAHRVDDVVNKARATQQAELAILREALAGGSLVQARERHGYHTLQRRQVS